MRLYYYGFIAIIKKFILRKNTGEVIKWFASKMGVVYIKFAQMLAMQNYGNIFTEDDRVKLSKICDECNPIKFKKIVKIIEKEYGCPINQKFKKIYDTPIGAASISQVHKGILKNGDVVAIKVKRKDVTKKIEKDIARLSRLIHRFGKFAKFKNFLGSDVALDLYLKWIKEEIDFELEKNNIVRYSNFAKQVNSKLNDRVNIVTPWVYKKMCTENIIVMEYIPYKTVNQMSLTNSNKKKISKALNDYICMCFYAMFNDKTVVFHGDPHGGNIYIDNIGNVGFLDFGLIFEFTPEETDIIKKLFFNAYNGNYKALTKLILDHSNYKEVDASDLEEKIKECCGKIKDIPVTEYFVEMINIFTKFNVSPLEILFKMAKAFISLYGINNFIDNKIGTENLLLPQIIEFYVSRTVNDFENLIISGAKIIPNFLIKTKNEGIIKGITDELVSLNKLRDKTRKTMDNLDEVMELLSNNYNKENS